MDNLKEVSLCHQVDHHKEVCSDHHQADQELMEEECQAWDHHMVLHMEHQEDLFHNQEVSAELQAVSCLSKWATKWAVCHQDLECQAKATRCLDTVEPWECLPSILDRWATNHSNSKKEEKQKSSRL